MHAGPTLPLAICAALAAVARAAPASAPSAADDVPAAPGQAAHERLSGTGQARPSGSGAASGAASAVPAGTGAQRESAAPRGPGTSRDTPMPRTGQDTSVMQPVEAGVADRGSLTESLRQMPMTLRMPGAFENVYPVPGRPGLFFRAQGALYAVFDEATYRMYRGTNLATIPPGSVFYVGKPDWSRIPMPWFRPAGTNDAPPVAEAGAAVSPLMLDGDIDAEIDPAGQSPSKLRADGRVPVRRAEVGGDLGRVPGSRAGFGGSPRDADALSDAERASALRSADERVRDAAASSAPDAAAMAGVVPSGVSRDMIVGSGADVRPRIVGDGTYRQQRLTQLMLQAVRSGRAPADR